jgi:hypothetical protein
MVRQGGQRMTIKELKDRLAFWDDDTNIVFEIHCDIEPESITKTKCGWYTVHLESELEPTFFKILSVMNGDCRIGIELVGVDE